MTRRVDVHEEFSIENIVNVIFSKAPLQPKSIDLKLDAESADSVSPDSGCMDIYMDIAILGAKYLYGENFAYASMTRAQYTLLNEYMNSFGVTLTVKCNDSNVDPWDLAAREGIQAVKKLNIFASYI